MRCMLSFIFGIAMFSMDVAADSSCWPERHLLGTPAKKIIYSANAMLGKYPETSDESRFDVDWETGVCYAKHYNPISGNLIGSVKCEALLCVNGDCGTDNENATLAVLQNNEGFVQALQKSGDPVWLKWIGDNTNRYFEPVLLWNDDDYGVISAELDDVHLYLHKEIGISIVDVDETAQNDTYNKMTHVYKVIGTEIYNGTTFLKLQRFSAIENDGDPELKIGEAEDVVYLEHRDPDGNLIATLSRYWCD